MISDINTCIPCGERVHKFKLQKNKIKNKTSGKKKKEFEVFTLYYLICPIFNSNNKNYKAYKDREKSTHTQEKSSQ